MQMLRRTAITLVAAAVTGWAAAKPTRAARASIRIPFWVTSGTASVPLAKLNGAPAKILRVQGPGDDLIVLLVLDLAGDLAQVDPARDAVVEGLGKLPANTWVALMRAQDGLAVLHDPTADREKIAASIKEMSISGRAGLLDTVETVADLGDRMLEKSRVRVAVFYVTDSNITNYREDFANPVINSSDSGDMSRRFPEGLVKERISRLRANLLGRETPLFIVHLDYRSDKLNEAYQTGLLEVATATGGSATFCRSNGEIPDAIAGMFQLIGSHQVAVIQSGALSEKQADVELAAEGADLKYRTRIQLRR